jgi:lysophospholipase L1-like esterase
MTIVSSIVSPIVSPIVGSLIPTTSLMLSFGGDTRVDTNTTIDSTISTNYRLEFDVEVAGHPPSEAGHICYSDSFVGIVMKLKTDGDITVTICGNVATTVASIADEPQTLHVDVYIALHSDGKSTTASSVTINGATTNLLIGTWAATDKTLILGGATGGANFIGTIKNFYYSTGSVGSWTVISDMPLDDGVGSLNPVTLVDNGAGQTDGDVLESVGDANEFGPLSSWVAYNSFDSRYTDIDEIRDAQEASVLALQNYSALDVTEIAATSQAVFDMYLTPNVWSEIVDLYPFALNGTDMLIGMKGDDQTGLGANTSLPSDATNSYDGADFTALTDFYITGYNTTALGGNQSGGLGIWLKSVGDMSGTWVSARTTFVGTYDNYSAYSEDQTYLRLANNGLSVTGHIRARTSANAVTINHPEQICNDLLYITNGTKRVGHYSHTGLPTGAAPAANNPNPISFAAMYDDYDDAIDHNATDFSASFGILSTQDLDQLAFRSIMITWLQALGDTGAGVATGVVIGDSHATNTYGDGTPDWDGWDDTIGVTHNLLTDSGQGSQLQDMPDKFDASFEDAPTVANRAARIAYMSAGVNSIDTTSPYATDTTTDIDVLTGWFETYVMDELDAKSITLVINSIPPSNNRNAEGVTLVRAYNAYLLAQSLLGRFEYIDIWPTLADPDNPDEYLEAYYTPFDDGAADGTHFNEAGHAAVATLVLAKITQLES